MSEEHTNEPVENEWVTLSASSVNYDKVIFADIPKTYPLENITVRFENAKGIVVSSDDFIGIYKIGFQNVSECLLKGVWRPEDEVIFKAEQLRKLDETEFYQFVYVSSEENIYGASTPFRLQSPNEDLFAEISEEDFLVVRSKLKEENMNLKKGMCKAAIRASILSNRVCVVEQQNAQLKEENMQLKEQIMKLKCDLEAEVENNRNHIVEEQLKEENLNLKKEIEKLKSDLCVEAQIIRNFAVHEELIKMVRAKHGVMRPPPKFQRDNSEIHEEMSTSVNSCSSQTCPLSKNNGDVVFLRAANRLLNKKNTELEKKIAEQNVTLKEDMEAIKIYHHKIKVLNEQISNSNDSSTNNSRENSLTNLLKRELEKKESEVEALKQSEKLVRGEFQAQHAKLYGTVDELRTRNDQLANKARSFEKEAFITKEELKKALINAKDLEAEKEDLELKVMELEERIEASNAILKRTAEANLRDHELISKLTEHKELVAEQLNKMSSEHCEAMEVLKTEKDMVIGDLKARLEEASIIFKQQYREIEKLRRTVKQLNAKKTKDESASVKTREFPESQKYVSDDDVSPSSSLKNASDGAVNDSDTGEHVGSLDTKSGSFSDDKNEVEQEDAKNVPSSRVPPNVFSNAVSDSIVVDVDSQEKANSSQLSSKQHNSPFEEHYFGAAYTAQPTFTYQPIERPPRRRFRQITEEQRRKFM